jgi:hypothetical protein
VLSEIGPSATGDSAKSRSATQSLVRVAPSRRSSSASTTIVAAPHSVISVLKAAL